MGDGIGEVCAGVSMKILFINEVCGHTSTGKICAEQAEKLYQDGNEVKIAYGRDDYVPEKITYYVYFMNNLHADEKKNDALVGRTLATSEMPINHVSIINCYNPILIRNFAQCISRYLETRTTKQ